MDVSTFQPVRQAMATVSGRHERYYYELCKCYPNPLCHPPLGVQVPALITASDKGCAICSVVKAGLATVLDGSIDPEYKLIFKPKEHGELRISYTKSQAWVPQAEI